MAFSKEKAHERAEKYAAKGQHDRAAREYQSVVEHDPKDVRAWLMLASSLARAGDRAGAISRYMQVADFYSSQKDRQKALAVYRQVLGLDPNRLDIHYKCAQLNLDIGRVHDAIASFEQIGQAQLQAGHVADALETYRVIADADPSIVSKRLRLAELYSRERMVDKAVDAFRRAGDLLLESDRKADFVRVAERLIYHKSDDRPTTLKLARVYLDLGDPRRALMKLNALLQIDQHDAAALELLAETFIALGKPDKAISVLLELVRGLREDGAEGDVEAARVVARGLEWQPGSPELAKLQTELAAAEPPAQDVASEAEPEDDAPIELDVDDSDVLELDDDDVVLADDSEPVSVEPPAPAADAKPDPEPGAPTMTERVLSDVIEQTDAPKEGEGPTDFDKILFEARVYIKYRLFDHALEHIDGLIEQQADHVAALSLKARALTELERLEAAADTHVRVAELVAASDPKLAREHVSAALNAIPEHRGASAMQAQLQEESAPVAVRPAGSGAVTSGDGDSGAFDLLDDDDSDFSIEVSDGEPPEGEAVAQPAIEVENRFGLSEAGPLPSEDSVAEPPANLEPQILHPSSGGTTEGTPAVGFIPAPAPTQAKPTASASEFAGPSVIDLLDDDDPSGAVAVPKEVPPLHTADFEGFDVDPESFADVQLDSQASDEPASPATDAGDDDPSRAPDGGPVEFDLGGGAVETAQTAEAVDPTDELDPSEEQDEPDVAELSATELILDDEDDDEDHDHAASLEVDLDPVPEPQAVEVVEEAPTAPVEPGPSLEAADPEPEVAAPEPEPHAGAPSLTVGARPDKPGLAPPGGWPDLSDDLAEIRFYVDQGLEDDAKAALDDLRERHPGHPELEALASELNAAGAPAPASQSGAQPLLDLVSEEDAEADAYLSAIFDDAEAPAPTRKVDVKARAADVQDQSARDHFDLGMAYREMGLVDAALSEFESAAADDAWACRALVMVGTLRVLRGETDRAVEDLLAAVAKASTEDERCEANYELGSVFEKIGDSAQAIARLQEVTAGYRDRDEKLAGLTG